MKIKRALCLSKTGLIGSLLEIIESGKFDLSIFFGASRVLCSMVRVAMVGLLKIMAGRG